ncbi:MAG TPA: universal stress protein [Puia sp.]|nr:universal stress protein [Puia sp.]
MKPIIVAVDFTERARNAAYYAADMALAMEADLHVFHAVPLPLTPADLPLGAVFDDVMKTAVRTLDSWAEDLRQLTKNQVTVTTVLEVGGLPFRLEEVCGRIKPFLVVMGGPGDPYSRMLAGDGSLYVVRHLAVPVLVVPPGVGFHAIRKVAIACELAELRDGMPVSQAFLEDIQRLFSAHFDILNVRTEKRHSYDNERFELYHWKESLDDLTPALHFLEAGTVEEGITQYIKDQHVDWLMVFPRRHGLLEFHRSRSKRIVLQCPVPVLSICEPAFVRSRQH